MINQDICINGLRNILWYPMQCCLNCVHISEVSKFLADSPSVITNTAKLADPIGAANPLIIHIQLIGVTSYFDVYSLSIDKHKNKDNPKIYLTAEESPSDPSTEE